MTTTLCVDIGGSGLKAARVDLRGDLITERLRVDTPYPCPPERLVTTLTDLVAPLGRADRATVGFPGLVRDGLVLHVPSLTRATYDGGTDVDLQRLWDRFPLESALQGAFGIPTKLLNDADVQGCAVIAGRGLEFVITLGTGVGTALFLNGHLLPHLELSHGPFKKDVSIDTALGNVERKRLQRDHWRARVRAAIDIFDAMLFFDHAYVGGGNAKHLDPSNVGPKGTIVSNAAGIIGGVRAWDLAH
ncbi:MAG: ROK family protein [Actinobacteria bacterium]|nr:ROK family protein [Actinomycetota bacterium]